jgi:hypothetical protein
MRPANAPPYAPPVVAGAIITQAMADSINQQLQAAQDEYSQRQNLIPPQGMLGAFQAAQQGYDPSAPEGSGTVPGSTLRWTQLTKQQSLVVLSILGPASNPANAPDGFDALLAANAGTSGAGNEWNNSPEQFGLVAGIDSDPGLTTTYITAAAPAASGMMVGLTIGTTPGYSAS